TAVFKSSITHTVTIFFIAFGVTLVYVLGVPMVQNNSITPGTLFLFTYYFQLIMTPILEILRQIQIIQQADASVERINEIFDIEKILIDDGKLIANTGPVDIEFDNIKFSYNEDNYVLQNINFLLPAGKSMGLIGKTGSGKTTLSRLIYRLYDYEIGNILINGNSNKEYALEELRKMIVVVTQEVQLFKGTIRDNITFFNESIDDEQVINALNMVGLDVWLNEQEEGINTQLDKTGLSAGEEQLLALARSFIVNPSIVILDEASSRLDPATQTLIESAMDKLLENRTSLVIAHRLETLEKVDDILILENGEILEYGSRVVLTNNPNSHYSKLRRIGLKEMLA
ncbi:MAG: ABC transporter ATP-binding protein/permease, partial [Candidatus Heimdallarchaeota archaeon]|nr:ABC transporter ATP-binding protein/permease [Candidatus Heimdallarchaeota archaeon]